MYHSASAAVAGFRIVEYIRDAPLCYVMEFVNFELR